MKQIGLLLVAALLSVAGVLAVGILLFGDFGETEGRILGTTALLAGYALVALPAAIVVDRGRLRALGAILVVLAVAGAALAIAAVWSSGGPSDTHGKALGTATAFVLATAQIAALSLRRSDRDPKLVRGLFAASSVLAFAAAALFAAILWAETDSEAQGRILGALVVLDLVAVALQPTLVRVRPKAAVYRFRVVLESGEAVDADVEASDLASAAAKAIRGAERNGRCAVTRLEIGRGPDRSP